MGTPPSPPPPNVPAFKENKDGEKPQTVREIMEKHRANPTCNACHGVMDPLGFSLENFDTIGAWRDKDRFTRTKIDASGKLVDGTAVNGPDDLRKALMTRPEQFVQTMTEKLMTYALGRSLAAYDMPTVRKIVRDAARDNYRFSSIVMGIVESAPFQMEQDAGGGAQPASRLRRPSLKWSSFKEGDSTMFITKKHLERRTFLRGVGAAVALPLLDAMIPARTALAQTAAKPTPHLGFIYFPAWRGHGPVDAHRRKAPASSSPTILKPLAPFQKQLTVVSNLDNKPAIGPACTRIAPGTWLSCVHPRASQDPYGGPTVDQIAAQHIGQDTPLPSLEVATEGRGGGGSCDRDYGCSYSGTISFRTPTTPLPMETDPRKLFQRLFGQGDTAEERKRAGAAVCERSRPGGRRSHRSAAQLWARRTRRCSPTIWTPCARSSAACRRWKRTTCRTSTSPMRPPERPPQFEQHINLMFDLVALAYQANMTRDLQLHDGGRGQRPDL